MCVGIISAKKIFVAIRKLFQRTPKAPDKIWERDENLNGELDLGFLNIPEEGFGFSNNPTILFSQPDFNDCKFTIENGDSISIPIALVYL